ncbi:TspO/MBR family protein [Chachezhania antarctica]|uniref:TspO/MBR family protein n=1 Tax=Chachezhania antarctica TaxID=2340860 RepID=UPI000EB48B2E|nr:TspO/MBR family protein [Chachezhania antarctica]|tara:strand:- start:51 stop:515 length:465 start_codon:yes stop_codon:yes gene_type:complete
MIGKEKRALAGFVALTLLMGTAIGLGFQPGTWYEDLTKPPFNPPDWIFGPVWTVLYVLIGIAGWRTWFRADDRQLKLLWIVQIGLNWLWTPAFFGLHSIGLGLVVVVAMLVAVLAFIVRAARIDRLSAVLFVPYALWVGFAALLNASILRLTMG